MVGMKWSKSNQYYYIVTTVLDNYIFNMNDNLKKRKNDLSLMCKK